MKMKIAHSVNPFLPISGRWIYNQIKYQIKYQPIILTTRTENLDNFPLSYHIFSLGDKKYIFQIYEKLFRRIGFGYFPFWLKICKKESIQLLHSHFGIEGYINLGFAKKANLKHVVSFYGVDMGLKIYYQSPWKNRYAKLFQEADAFIVEGPKAKNTLIGMGCPAQKIYINHLGVDIDHIPFKERFYSNIKPIKILIAGVFAEKKGIEYGVKAFIEVSKIFPNINMTIIGDARRRTDENIIKNNILKLIKENNIGNKIKLLGKVTYNELIRLAIDHHIFLSPSIKAANGDTEGGAPVTLMDMSATGLPVVSTFHCDIPEVVIHEKSGLLSPEKDVNSLVNHLTFLIDHPEKGIAMGQYGRVHIEKEFNARIQANKLELIYDRVMSQS